jgi:hypothetical protein
MRRGKIAGVGLLALMAVALLAIAPSPAGARTAADVDSVHVFPSASSNVVGSVGFIDDDEVGYFWSVSRGDSVSETFNGPNKIKHAILDVEVVTNVLNSGAHVDWDLLINSQKVGSFTVNEGDVGPVHLDVRFPRITGGVYRVTIRVTNEVPSGQGSHTLAYAGSFKHSIKLKKR